MMMTAGTLYEAVEPNHLEASAKRDIRRDRYQRWRGSEVGKPFADISSHGLPIDCLHAICMAIFILRSFFVQDEEIQVIHLPVVFVAIAEFLTVRIPFVLRYTHRPN
jgi:hypothetical protein